MDLFSKLHVEVEGYLETERISQIHQAYVLAADAHQGQTRRSGEAYITHPVAVACIMAQLRLDHQSIMAALLHDVIEDTGVNKEDLCQRFGDQVADLVDGVSKLTQISFQSREEAQAENFRKMLMAMSEDIRVIMVKLADRLHNMRTLGHLSPEKRRRIATETLEIYAPIAHRLGMNEFKLELQDLGFQSLYPLRYRILQAAVKKIRGNRNEILHKIETKIKQGLNQEGVDGHVISREKHLYSIYLKMREKNHTFQEVMDIFGFRLVVNKVDTCYRALGIVHHLFKPIHERFKDYIAIPKANGYQSLHTTLFGPAGLPIEIQIRDQDMNNVANRGIASHWQYKSGETARNNTLIKAREWLRTLVDIQKNAGNPLEFIENVKIDLFPDEVYIFTPKGLIFALPTGATSVDFAYAVHTQIGNCCIAAKINGRLASLSTALKNSEVVEIITAPAARPNAAWLSFVQTAKARSSIRHFLKNQQRTEAIDLGKRLLDKALASENLTTDNLSKQQVDKLLKEAKAESMEQLLSDIGLCNRMAILEARRVTQQNGPNLEKPGKTAPLAIRGTEGMLVNFAKCCRPIPGDAIVGFLTTGRGIMIHTEQCPLFGKYHKSPEKHIAVQWGKDVNGEFEVELRIEVANQRGVLAVISNAIAAGNANIETISVSEAGGRFTNMFLSIMVIDRLHLARIIRRIRRVKAVVRVNRTKKKVATYS